MTWDMHFANFELVSCSVEKGVLRNVEKFTEKHLCERLFFNKVASTGVSL